MWVFSFDPDHIPDTRISPIFINSPSVVITSVVVIDIIAFNVPDPDPGTGDIIFIRSSETSDRPNVRFVLDVKPGLGTDSASMIFAITTTIPCLSTAAISEPINSIADTPTPKLEYIPRSRSRKTP
jgi:hypothetical protein